MAHSPPSDCEVGKWHQTLFFFNIFFVSRCCPLLLQNIYSVQVSLAELKIDNILYEHSFAMDEEYWRIVNDKLYSVVREGRHKLAWNGPNENAFEDELQILRPQFKPLVWGLGSAVAVFISFRLKGKLLRSGTTSSGHLNNSQKAKMEELKSGLSIPSDILLSALVGCSSTLFLTDTNQLKAEVAKVPLVKGRSFVSDELCSDFISEFERVSSKEATSLDKSLQTFIMNCQKRKKVENHLKNQMDYSDDNETYVSIPNPGVQYILSGIEKSGEEKE